MHKSILFAVSCGLLIAALGCGGGDGGDSGAVASTSGTSAPPPPPGGPPGEKSTSTAIVPAGDASGGEAATGSADASGGYPGGASGPPGGYGSGPPGGSVGGYGPAGGGYGPPPDSGTTGPGGAYPPGVGPAGGYPGAGSADGGASPGGGYGGYPGSGDGSATPPSPRPKSLREKAVDAFRNGQADEGSKLLAAHYLTNPSAGSELGRVMQFSPHLRKPALLTRVGLAVVFSSQPANFEGHPQPIGSTQLEAALASMEQRANEARGGGGGGEGGGQPRRGRNFGRPGGQNAGGDGALALAGPGDGGYGGSGGGQDQMPSSPAEEVTYFTGELGEKLLAALRTRLEAGAFGHVYRDALKELPVAATEQTDENGYPGGAAPSGPGPRGGMRSSPPRGAASGPPGGQGERGVGAGVVDGGGDGSGGEAGESGGIVTGQLAPGIEFLGAAQNMKELGELVKASSVDVVIFFEVRVRPATAVAFVNNDTSFRVAPAHELNKALYTSATLNNRKVHDLRKKKTGEDPVEKEVSAAMAALDAGFKHVPLPALTSEQAMNRLKSLIEKKPEDATALLLEARLFVAKKLLKPDEAVTLALTGVTDDQLGRLSEVVEEGDIKEKIASALSGKRADAPTTVLGKFGAALSGAGGLGGLVPTPQLPPIGLSPGGAVGGYGPPGGGGGYGPPAGAGGYGPPAGGTSDGPTLAPPSEAPRGVRGN